MTYISMATSGKPVFWMAFWLFLSTLIPPSSAFACGGIFDVACNLQNGGLSPGNIVNQTAIAGQNTIDAAKKAGQDVANAINEFQASVLSGPTLEQAIIASRNSAINGAMPIPPHIRHQLTGYASEDSMNRVRYKIGDNGFVNLARLLEQGGLASAVTLIDVVVFHGPSEAADLSIWAHELTHVDQYGSGAHSFAVRYARNWQSIEGPAYDKGDGFLAWQQSQASSTFPTLGQQQQQQQQQQQASGFPPGFGMLVCGCYGNGPAIAAEPRCASGAVRINICPGFCSGGGSPYAYVCQ